MTPRQRLQCMFSGTLPDDRLAMIEWAMWWDKTIEQWEEQGLPKGLSKTELYDYFGLDRNYQHWMQHMTKEMPKPATHGAPRLSTQAEYDDYRKRGILLPDCIESIKADLEETACRQERGEITWFTFDGFFWYPRILLGIEEHLYSFYDQPEFYHHICQDLVEWQLKMIEKLVTIVKPDFMTFAEDMSYNNGPMLSEDCFNEFMKPYYQMVIPELKKHGIKVIVDSDGDISKMVPWLIDAGIEGILPLERQAGVDIVELNKKYPDFYWIGGFDKMTMFQGEEAMRAEFERLLPALKSGHYIAAVDHQTPPGVTLENYKKYVKLFEEYSIRAVKEK